MRQGASWTYTGEAGPRGSYTFTDQVTDLRSDGFTLTADFDGLRRVQEWSCTAQGLVALDFSGGGRGQCDQRGIECYL